MVFFVTDILQNYSFNGHDILLKRCSKLQKRFSDKYQISKPRPNLLTRRLAILVVHEHMVSGELITGELVVVPFDRQIKLVS